MATKQLTGLQESDLEFNDPPRLVWVRVKDAVGLLWKDNPKLHDVGGVVLSLQKHGYQEFPKYDINLTNVNGKPGAIKAGNGRIESLFRMEQDKMEMPRGLAKVKDTGDWAVAIGAGVDAANELEAKAYAIDSNNLTMAGGDFDGLDMSKMWDREKYIAVLQGLKGNNPVSVDAETIENLTRYYSSKPPSLDQLETEFGEPNERDFWPIIRVMVSPDTMQQYEFIMDAIAEDDEAVAFANMLALVDIGKL